MAEKTPLVRLMTVSLSTPLCALADEHVPQVAELLLAIPRLPGNLRELLRAIRGSWEPSPRAPRTRRGSTTDRTTLLRVVALAALALCAGSNRDTDDIDIDTDRRERIA